MADKCCTYNGNIRSSYANITAEFPNSVPVIVNVNVTLNYGGAAGEASSRRQQKWPLHWGCTFSGTY